MNNWFYSLSDTTDKWFGEDKIGHFFGAAYAYTLGGWWLVIIAGLAIETIELWRYLHWDKKGPWPFLTDKVSLKDLIVDLLGAAVAAVIALIL